MKSDNGNAVTDSKKFANLAKTVFSPVYSVIAQQIVEKCKIKRGICIDIGSGPALLSIALARITDLHIYALDISEEMCEFAKENIKAEGVFGRITPTVGDVHNMPFDNKFADLIVSKGSVFFWGDRAKALGEVYRVLKQKGMSYIGGGFGTAELRAKITEEMRHRDANWERNVEERIGKKGVVRLKGVLNKAKISDYEIIHDDSGLWILIKKSGEKE